MPPKFQKREARIPFTREGYENVLHERQRLRDERPSAVEDLRKAREMGDLSENGYYKAARAKLSSIDANLRKIERLVKLGIVVAPKSDGTVDIGSTITLSDGEKDVEYTIVGGYESDPGKQTISHISPLGKSVLGKKVGDTVTVQAPVGTKQYTIKNLR